MKAVLLAGGKGTRLRPLTYSIPKPLLPLLDRPMIEHVTRSLPEGCPVIVTAHYMIDMLRRHFADRPDHIIVEETEPLGTGGAVKNVQMLLDERFVVLNGDIISSIDIPDMVRYHEEKGGKVTIALYPVEDPSRFGVVELQDDRRITSFVEKPAPGTEPSNMINAGVYIMEPEVLDLMPEGRCSFERDLFPKLPDGDLYGYLFDGYWVDAGTPASYLAAQSCLLDDLFDGGPFIGGGASIDPAAVIGDNVAVLPGAKISGRTSLISATIFPGAEVKGGGLESVLLGPDCRLADEIVSNVIIGKNDGEQERNGF